MTPCVSIIRVCTALAATACGLLAACSGGLSGEEIYEAQNKIFNALQTQGIYERGNLPEENPPTPEQLKGYFDIVGGAYRHIVNEDRDNRDMRYLIERGDSISFMFDARIFTGGNYENMQTFYTNIQARIQQIAGNNGDFDTRFWPADPFGIKVGEDRRILKSLQEALISCVAGDNDPDNDEDSGNATSDQVRVYLTPDIAFGDRVVYSVPAGSTLVFEVTDIEIIR